MQLLNKLENVQASVATEDESSNMLVQEKPNAEKITATNKVYSY